jgi:hypothetical protein
MPLPVDFSNKSEADNYRRMDYNLLPDGNIIINANPETPTQIEAELLDNDIRNMSLYYTLLIL